MASRTLICRSSRALPSSRTSLIEEIELVVRVGLVPAGLVRADFEAVAPERLCLPAKGAFLTPSETEARGRVTVVED